MPITQAGALNTTALTNPGVYVQIVPPGVLNLNGVPTNKIGVVGSATWGPVGTPVIVSGLSDYSTKFGPLQNRKYDMGTQVALAAEQGANNFLCVRWTDGNDVAATATLAGLNTQIIFNALYTGTLGNSIVINYSQGSRSGTTKVTVSIGGGMTNLTLQPPEVFDNIVGSGNALNVAVANAINMGIGLRGPSLIVRATAGAATGTPALNTPIPLSGGLDGASTPNAVNNNPTIAYGADALPRTGMYALRGTGCGIGLVADMDTSTAWTTIDGFGQSEGVYMIQCGPSGDTISNAVATKATAGLDSYSSKYLHGDWLYWQDPVNGVLRLVSPQGWAAGREANLAPNFSGLNQPIYGISGSQKSGVPGSTQAQQYAAADIAALELAGIDVIANPSPGGTYWSLQTGHNSSSNAAINGDSYTRMTNYIAETLSAGMGKFVGQPITPQLFQNVTATLNQFLAALVGSTPPLLSTAYGIPYSILCGPSNNPQSRTALGYLQADAQVEYEGIAEKFLINMQGGATVTIYFVRESAGG